MASRSPSTAARQTHAPSYYAATANDKTVRPSLTDDICADVCVIGAGFTGLSAALELAERGFSVVVLEAVQIGFGASGRNGGQIVNGYSRDLDVIEKRYGEPAATALGAMSLEGASIIRSRIAKYHIACDLVDGAFFAAFTDKQMKELEHQKRVWEPHGHDGLEMVDRSDVPAIVACDRYVGGMVDRHGGHIHPLNLVLGEAAAFESLGGRIFEHSSVVTVETGAAPLARTAEGSVACKVLLVCGNAYLGKLLPEIGDKMMPVSSQIIATEPLDAALADELLPANYCVEDMNYILDYYRRTADNRILYGGGVVYGGRDPASVEARLRPQLAKTFPRLASVRFDYAWSGNFALTLTRVPHVGQLTPTVYFSHGDSGHGVTTTHLLGKILGEAVAGQAERLDVWSSLPYYPFPGGSTFRVPLTALGAWWYGLRDRLGV
ncbi:FAD-binding oxidoreductase [Lichenihabitans sp. PAMC28606]|uniref:NAD(P)/FAD-dependent oxidoreductase n=1 Tax=Lichenihabitans sp. PAMC28606 TaxID=2880932 RepID=UPI001D0AB10E|nr:FAD-binding oxidoreductase [Lichenihabitans sp. PAMC28606]UDL94141.1 FAD-binding oxidoreductase [Lichenihabitans sp. PAMC28606]